MAIVEQGQCKITSINSQGLGEGKTDLGIVDLPFTLPGEVAEFERHTYRRRSNCILTSIVAKVPERAVPPCPNFGTCGGCLLQHLPEKMYNEFKYNILLSALSYSNIDTKIRPLITIPAGNRRRANLSVVKRNSVAGASESEGFGTKKTNTYLGFHRFRSHRIININNCIALDPELSKLISPLQEVFDKVLAHKQEAQIFMILANNGIEIAIEIHNKKELPAEHRQLFLDFAIKHNVTRLFFRHRKTIDVIYETDVPYVLFGGVKVEVDSYCFLQSSSLSDKILADLVVKYVGPEIDQNIVDLFCGRGTYSLPLSISHKVGGVELDAKALSALSKALTTSGRSINLMHRDLFLNPLKSSELNKYTVAIINPPRAGALDQCLEFKNSKIEKIIYVSCNPESFARDAAVLLEGGYVLDEVTPVDQFYWSPHLEVVGVFLAS